MKVDIDAKPNIISLCFDDKLARGDMAEFSSNVDVNVNGTDKVRIGIGTGTGNKGKWSILKAALTGKAMVSLMSLLTRVLIVLK